MAKAIRSAITPERAAIGSGPHEPSSGSTGQAVRPREASLGHVKNVLNVKLNEKELETFLQRMEGEERIDNTCLSAKQGEIFADAVKFRYSTATLPTLP